MARRPLRSAQLERQEKMQARVSGGQLREPPRIPTGEAKWGCATCHVGEVFPGTPEGLEKRDAAVASHHRDHPDHTTVPPART